MNSTDKQKLVIRKMFEEPINEVEELANWILNNARNERGTHILADLETLQQKITHLKSILPTIQS